jgi:hypothetical protein
MHFLQNLLSYMCPPFKFIGVGGTPPPPVPYDYVITYTGAFVVTNTGANVIADHT